MKSVVKIVTNKPGKAPKAEPCGEMKEYKVETGPKKGVCRGQGAAKKGCNFTEY